MILVSLDPAAGELVLAVLGGIENYDLLAGVANNDTHSVAIDVSHIYLFGSNYLRKFRCSQWFVADQASSLEPRYLSLV
jgi:hypothetical protein